VAHEGFIGQLIIVRNVSMIYNTRIARNVILQPIHVSATSIHVYVTHFCRPVQYTRDVFMVIVNLTDEINSVFGWQSCSYALIKEEWFYKVDERSYYGGVVAEIFVVV